MFAFQAPEAITFPHWGFWAISLVTVFIVYLIGFKLGYKRGKKD